MPEHSFAKVVFEAVLLSILMSNSVVALASDSDLGQQVGDSCSDESLGFAHELFRDGDYYRAITEYKRFLFMEPDPMARAWVRLRIGQSYLAGKKYSAAQAVFLRLSKGPVDEKTEHAARFLLGRSYFLDGRYSQALDELARLRSHVSDSELLSASYFLAGCADIRMGALDDARKSLEHVAANDPLGDKAQALLAALERGKRLKHKSPILAGVLSVVPGLGHVYIGEYGVGLSALVWNGMFAYASVESFRHSLWGPAVLLAVVELMWYSGTIYGAVSGAHRFNRDAELNFLQALDDDVGLDASLPAKYDSMSFYYTGRF